MTPRFDRQSRLKEIGAAGQARIERAEVKLRSPAGLIGHTDPTPNEDGSTEWLAKEYLERAGVRHVRWDSKQDCVTGLTPHENRFVHEDQFAEPEARALATGAHRALCLLKDILDARP